MLNVPLYNAQGTIAGQYQLNWSEARAVGSRLVKAQILKPRTPGWHEVAEMVKHTFNQVYQADVHLAYPQVMGLYVLGHVSAHLEHSPVRLAVAAGFRGAESEDLFLERYLPQPIETYFDCSRADIVELGSLASQERGYNDILFSFLACHMRVHKRQVAVLTATKGLLVHLKRLGLTPLILGPAQPDLLTDDERARWGHYYDNQPQICAFSAADIPLLEKRFHIEYQPILPVATECKDLNHAVA